MDWNDPSCKVAGRERFARRILPSRFEFGGFGILGLALALAGLAFGATNPDPAQGVSPKAACADLLSLSRSQAESLEATPMPASAAEPSFLLESEAAYLSAHSVAPSFETQGGAKGGNSGYIARAIRVARETKAIGVETPHFFVDFENSVLKPLNDKVYGNKKVPDAIQNAFMKALQFEFGRVPLLQTAFERAYGDYKSARFAGSVDDPARRSEIIEAMGAAYQRAVTTFVEGFEQNELSVRVLGLQGQLGDPRNWFLAGWGRTADESNAAVRAARSILEPGGTPLQSFDAVKPLLRDRLIQLRRVSASLDQQLSAASSVLSRHPLLAGESRALSVDAIELMRKIDPSQPDAAAKVRGVLRERLSEELTAVQARAALDLFQLIDGFSASIQIEERKIIDLSKAGDAGIVSVDLAGMGALNLHETGVGLLALPEPDPTLGVRAARAAVGRADQVMEDLKSAFHGSVMKVLGQREANEVVFSGDDGILMPHRPLAPQNKDRLLEALARRSKMLRSFRVTFVPRRYPGGTEIPVIERSRAIVTAENFEKDLRARLDVRLSRVISNRLLFGVEFQPVEGGGGSLFVRIVQSPDETPLSAPQRQILEEAVREGLSPGLRLEGVHWIGEVGKIDAGFKPRPSSNLVVHARSSQKETHPGDSSLQNQDGFDAAVGELGSSRGAAAVERHPGRFSELLGAGRRHLLVGEDRQCG